MWDNVKNALLSIWSNKVRSVLTVLGVVLGVTSVTTLVSLGQGLKNDVSQLIQGFGTNVIMITSGKIDTTNPNGSSSNPANFISTDILTLEDVDTLATQPNIDHVSPISLVGGSMAYGDKTANPVMYGTYSNMLDILVVLQLDQGRMFTDSDTDVVVLSEKTKQALFGDSNAIGKQVTIGGQTLEVVGTLGKGKNAGMFGSEIDALSLVPLDTATSLNKDKVKISRIAVKADDTADVTAVKQDITATLLDLHNGEEDFTVLTQDDLLGLFNTFLNLATTMVSAIAAISLIVGGIGIMNIMLVTVTERTREIGLRKAVGATRGAILIQFLTEAVMVTLVGSLIGLLLSFIASWIIASQTELKPEITGAVILIAVGISVVIGVIFGLWPAIRAAKKDPIEALRYE